MRVRGVFFFLAFFVSAVVQAAEFTDSTGRTVTVPDRIDRVVPSGPAAQMMLLSLAPEKLSGLSNPLTADMKEFLPEQYHSLPVFGQFYGAQNLNAEALLAAGPQVIIDVGETKTSAGKDMDALTQRLGIPAVHIRATLKNTPEAYRRLGKLLGVENRAERLAAFTGRIYERALDIVSKAGNNKVRVMQTGGSDGLNVTVSGNYHAELINLVADNVADVPEQTGRSYGTPVNMEQILVWNPDVVLFAPGSIYDTAAADPAWSRLGAIRGGQYYEIPGAPYNWLGTPPSVNRYLGLIWLPFVLYPGLADYDLYEETAQYYRLFYRHDLSRARFDALTAKAVPAK